MTLSHSIYIYHMKYLIYYLLSINVSAILLYGFDKLKAIKGWYRISESTLLLVGLIGGSFGSYIAMKLFHHKTLKKKFTLTIPIFMCIHIGVILLYIFKVL